MSVHLKIPLTIGADGTFLTVPEDSTAEILQNVTVILRTRTGERLATPDLGTPNPVFQGFDAASAIELISAADPRATVDLVRQAIDSAGKQTTDLTVRRRET
jgi:phage baseplate assembly protein W